MEYLYGKNDNYEDYASGRVLYQNKGITNFPARLAQEIFGRCLSYAHKKSDLCIYDCCCGGAYMLTVLGFLNAKVIDRIIGSDISQQAVEVSKANLELLTLRGMDKRLNQIRELKNQYQKASHTEAEVSAERLRKLIENEIIETAVFHADALMERTLEVIPDLILTDVPYGDLVSWQGTEAGSVNQLLDYLYPLCGKDTIIGICMDKSQKNTNPKFKRLEKQQIGKRRFEILSKIDS
jgi:hypothetical protein